MPTRSALIAAAAAMASAHAAAVGSNLAAGSAEADIRSPFAGGGDAADGADHRAGGDDEPEVVPHGRDQLLDERSVPLEPGLDTDFLQAVVERFLACRT